MNCENCTSGSDPRCRKSADAIEDLKEVMNADLVAFIFKEVFSKFRAYKKAPQKFDRTHSSLMIRSSHSLPYVALINRMNKLEKQAFESLVRAFWDVSPDDVKL